LVGYPSGQRGQTVNLLAYAFTGSNPVPTTIFSPASFSFSFCLFLVPLVSRSARSSMIFQLGRAHSNRDFSFGGIFLLAVEDRDVADEGDQAAVGFRGEFRGEGFLLVFEIVEFYFDEFAAKKGFADHREERFAEAVLADLQRGVEALGDGFEFGDLGGRKVHVRSVEVGWLGFEFVLRCEGLFAATFLRRGGLI
jgi:hypothetical protein